MEPPGQSLGEQSIGREDLVRSSLVLFGFHQSLIFMVAFQKGNSAFNALSVLAEMLLSLLRGGK